MRPAPRSSPVPVQRPGGCCGCLLFPGVLAFFGGAASWFGGFTVGLLLHTLAALVWAGTQAAGHVLFGWRLPALRRPDRDRRPGIDSARRD